jgi:tRNA dimethylallyltransferase
MSGSSRIPLDGYRCFHLFLLFCMWRQGPVSSFGLRSFVQSKPCHSKNTARGTLLRLEKSLNSSMATVKFPEQTEKSSFESHPNLVVILAGPTAIGKSAVAAQLCRTVASGGVVVSADSVQCYHGVQIGANKPSAIELAATPHLLVDILGESNSNMDGYNAAEWRRDAVYCIDRLVRPTLSEFDDEDISIEPTLPERCQHIKESIDGARAQLNKNSNTTTQSILPVVVGGTMMYMDWLVHGRPDAMRPSTAALERAKSQVETMQNESCSWNFTIAAVAQSLGEPFVKQVKKLSENDWYRLRRILEVAFTVQEQGRPGRTMAAVQELDTTTDVLYSGQRKGSLADLGYDVRCFFLCPDNRKLHCRTTDEQCEAMLIAGLLAETTNPACPQRAIGFLQFSLKALILEWQQRYVYQK